VADTGIAAQASPASRLAPYRAVLGSRVRSQRSYRASFAVDLLSSLLAGLVEIAEVWVLYRNAPVIGGLDFHQVLLVFGLADICFSLADMVVGHCDTLPTYLRAGTLDVFYLRPQPLLAQLVTSDISLRRLARVAVGVVALVAGLWLTAPGWSLSTVALLAMALVFGTITFAAMFVLAAGLQFFVINGPEVTNAFVYGGRYAATQPASVWSKPLQALFGFAFPMAFTAYLPVLAMLDLPGSAWLPSWLGWCTPLAALWACAAAAIAWRCGVRHYQGGGG
jgi:ABC-2 type transport system permease protein